jgi:hypothetical protein
MIAQPSAPMILHDEGLECSPPPFSVEVGCGVVVAASAVSLSVAHWQEWHDHGGGSTPTHSYANE